MSEIILDLRNYKDRTSSKVPEGDYLVSIEDAEVGESSKGDTMITVFLRIVGGEQDGMALVDRLTLTESAMFRVVGFLQGLGIKTPRKQIKVNPSSYVGRRVRVMVADGKPWNGSVRSEVKSYIRTAATGSTAAADDLDALDDEVDAPEETVGSAPKRQPKSVPAEPADTLDDLEADLDDIDDIEV